MTDRTSCTLTEDLPVRSASTVMTAVTCLAGRYRAVRLLGGGGMGQVWLGVDTHLGREVAIKILHPEAMSEVAARARMEGEARAVAQIDHPNVVTVLDHGAGVGDDPRARFVVMEHVPGVDLAHLLRQRHRLAVGEVLDLLAQLGAGLDAAHRVGVVHRDVKPANVIMRPDGRIVLTDFGIARSPQSPPLTRTGQIVGTAHYMAPEVARGEQATPASDLYAAGVLAYVCLTGRHPFPDGPALSVLHAHVHSYPPTLPEDVPAPVRALILDLLAKDPHRRPPSAASLAQRARELATTYASREPGPGGGVSVSDPWDASRAAPNDQTRALDQARALDQTRALDQARALSSLAPTPTRALLDPPTAGPQPGWARRGRVVPTGAPGATLRWVFRLLAVGATVLIVVVLGERPPAPVPEVVGTTAPIAERALTRAGFHVRTQMVDVAHKSAGIVVGQLPAATRTAPAGSQVTIEVATGYLSLDGSTYLGQSCDAVTGALGSLGLTPVLTAGSSDPGCTVAALSPSGRIPVTAVVTLTAASVPTPTPTLVPPHAHGRGHGHRHD